MKLPKSSRMDLVTALIWIRPGSPLVSIREAVLIASPKRQYFGSLSPTTPATQDPELIPIRI